VRSADLGGAGQTARVLDHDLTGCLPGRVHPADMTAVGLNLVNEGPKRIRARLPLRTWLAVRVGRLAARLSRAARLGQGRIIGGRVTLLLDGRALHRLTRGRTVILVTGTNGKTTTTLMLSQALGGRGAVATNSGGANMPDGLVAALAADLHAPYAVLETDEAYLPVAARAVRPAAIVLLNLSRDQLDRVSEPSQLERSIRSTIADQPQATVIANADDVLVTSAALAAARPTWVAAGGSWHVDSASCPRCGAEITRRKDGWSCICGLRRPSPSWTLDGDAVLSPSGGRVTLALQLPGRANQANAVLALAALSSVGVSPPEALQQIRALEHVDGRYRILTRGDHAVRLLLAKNPAGWAETLTLLNSSAGTVVLAINGHVADGQDLSWLWDVCLDPLAGHAIIACGGRAADLAVRLDYADLPHTLTQDPIHAIDVAPAGPVDVIANYTAFRRLQNRLGHGR